MRIGYRSAVAPKSIVIGAIVLLAVVLLCVPAAFAKGPNGHGKPAWAGGGNDHGKPAWAGHGKPPWAGQGKGHGKGQEKAKHQQAESEEADAEDGELDLDDLNPAWYCKTLESMMNEEDAEAAEGDAEPGEFSSFDTEFGTNDNKRNSFGMCVSRRAHGEDLSGGIGPDIQDVDMPDADLFGILYNGIPEGGMPDFATLGSDRVWKIVTFVKYQKRH